MSEGPSTKSKSANNDVDMYRIDQLSGVIYELREELDAGIGNRVGRLVDLLDESSNALQGIRFGVNYEVPMFPRLSGPRPYIPRITRAQYVRDAVIDSLTKIGGREDALARERISVEEGLTHFDKATWAYLRLRQQKIVRDHDAAIHSHECLERALRCLNEALSLNPRQWAVDTDKDLTRETQAKSILSKLSARLKKLEQMEQFPDAARKAALQALMDIESAVKAAISAIPHRGDIASTSLSEDRLQLTCLKSGQPYVTYVVSAKTGPPAARGSPRIKFKVQVVHSATGGRTTKDVSCKDSRELTELLIDTIVEHAAGIVRSS
jgi:hypothetical protein